MRQPTANLVVAHQQHLDGQQVDEDHALVLLAGAVAVLEGEGQVLLRWMGEERKRDKRGREGDKRQHEEGT